MTFKIFRFTLIVSLGSLIFACGSGDSSTSNVQQITYTTINCPDSTVNVITGVRGVNSSTDVYLTGICESKGTFLYRGPQDGGGIYYTYNYPSSNGRTVTDTTTYGPNNGFESGCVQVVGAYATTESAGARFGFLYQGPESGSPESSYWITLVPDFLPQESPSVLHTYAHSTMGGLVVGNYDTSIIAGAFVYDIKAKSYFPIIIDKNALFTTAYGIWYNDRSSYTIVGGYSMLKDSQMSVGYIANWDNATHSIVNYATYTYNNQSTNDILTHFEGITTDGNGGYNLAAEWAATNTTESFGAFVNIPRTQNGGFGTASWTNISYPGSAVTGANTVYQTSIYGLYFSPNQIPSAFIATIN